MKRMDAQWCEGMRLRLDLNCMMWEYVSRARAAAAEALRACRSDFSGSAQEALAQSGQRLSTPDADGLRSAFVTPEELAAVRPLAEAAFAHVSAQKGDAGKMMAWTRLPREQEAEVAQIKRMAEGIRDRFDNFVVLGIGGSALGPIAVQQAICDLRYNELPREVRGGPRLYVEDNVDPERMASLLRLIDPKRTCFNVISKSGNTSETMSQYMIISDILKKLLGSGYAANMVITTDAEKGNLRRIARADGVDSLVVPDGVGGRFSELSPVGLLAAAVCGVDIEEMLAGAAYMDSLCASDSMEENPALFAAAMMYLSMEKGMNISVMMPYADSLRYMADWYAQLWAESLGKRRKLDGTPCAVGQTPVKALGVTDQHSQVQLYTEGPADKLVTFLAVDEYRARVDIPAVDGAPSDIAFLAGRTLNELIDTERRATAYALLKAAKPSWTITLPQVNEFTLGQLMYLLEMTTAYCGALLGIDAFDQPGVEEGKNAAYAMLGRDGYAYKQREMDALLPPMDKFRF